VKTEAPLTQTVWTQP